MGQYSAFQALYQGLGPSVAGVIFTAIAIHHLGAIPLSAIVAGVPGIATLAAYFYFQEAPTIFTIIGLFSCHNWCCTQYTSKININIT